jgi:hypothetical protein
MAVDILELARLREGCVAEGSVEFVERVSRMHDFLTAFKVLPTKRAVMHGQTHRLFCGLLLVIHDEFDGKFSLSSRNLSELAKLPLGSGVVAYLDAMVAATLLQHDDKAYQFLHVLNMASRKLTPAEVISA